MNSDCYLTLFSLFLAKDKEESQLLRLDKSGVFDTINLLNV